MCAHHRLEEAKTMGAGHSKFNIMIMGAGKGGGGSHEHSLRRLCAL